MPPRFSYKNDSDEDQRASPEETAKDLHDQEQQSGFDRDFNDLTNPEHQAKDGKEGDLGEGVRDAEDAGGNWKSEYGGNKSKGGRTLTPMNVRSILKKRGPLGLIAVLGLGGGLVGTALFSPALLLVHMKEAIVNRMDTQLTTMDTRTTKLLGLKVKRLTTGICSSKITIKCKYATMTAKQAQKLEKAGIKVNSSKSVIPGRVKPDSLEFKNKTITADNFNSEFKSNPELQSAFKKDFNPKYARFSDKVWQRVAKNLGINKTKALPDTNDPAEKKKAIEEQTKSGKKLTIKADDSIVCDKDNCTKNGEKLNKEDSKAARATKAAAIESAKAVEEVASETAGTAAKELGEVAGDTFKKAAGFLNVTGGFDDACTAYSSIRALGYAAKTIRAVQLARYAMVFLNAADQIKAGTFSSSDGAYLGGILTNVTYDAVSGVKRKAAMDSFGMQYALFGSVGKSDSYVSQFMAGGGLTGDLIAVTSYINNVLGKTPLATCKVLGNPAVQFGSLAVGIALLLIPGVGVGKLTVGTIVKGVSGVALQVGLALLPGLLKDVVAGNTLNNIVGEDSGNAIAAGGGKIMSDACAAGGCGLMSVDDALAYNQAQNDTIAMYSQQDRLTANPLDARDSNTFLGSIVGKLLPYTSNMSSVASALTGVGSFVGSSLGSVIPKSSALSTEELRSSYTSCTDVDYKALGIATDPMCNPIYGIPTQYLSADPNQVVDDLMSNNQIDDTTGIPVSGSVYESYIKNCTNRDRPIGDVGDSFDQPDGSECIIKDQQTANFALFTNDQRVQNGMDDGGTGDGTDTASVYDFYSPTEEPSTLATVLKNQSLSTTESRATSLVPMSLPVSRSDTTGCVVSNKQIDTSSITYKIVYGIV